MKTAVTKAKPQVKPEDQPKAAPEPAPVQEEPEPSADESQGQITIQNLGEDIVRSNFWETSYNQNNEFFLSFMSGTFRLLLPEGMTSMLTEMENVKKIFISRGYWAEHDILDAYEILFEDYSDSPFCVWLAPTQVDRHPASEDAGKMLSCSLWRKGPRKAFEAPAEFRLVEEIPTMGDK
jgi:hypothetical protein